MAETGRTGDVLVAVEDPDHVTQLVRTAADMARQGTGRVRLISVVAKPRDSPFSLFTDETIVREFADDSHELIDQAPDPEGVEVVRDLVVARSVAKGIVSAVKRTEPAALIIGWDSDPSRSDALLGTVVDTVFERASTDVYAERMGREAEAVESILVPIAGGPHVRAAVNGAGAIARENDAEISLLAVTGETVDAETAADYLESGQSILETTYGGSIDVDTTVGTGTSAESVIVDAAPEHDIIVLGASRKGALRGRLVGSVPRQVVRQTEETVIVARDRKATRGLFGHLRRLLATNT